MKMNCGRRKSIREGTAKKKKKATKAKGDIFILARYPHFPFLCPWTRSAVHLQFEMGCVAESHSDPGCGKPDWLELEALRALPTKEGGRQDTPDIDQVE